MSLIEIRPPISCEEYDQACALVEDVYYEHGITTQRAVRHPKAIFVAVREGTVLGSIGFRVADEGTLPAEHYFGFDLTELGSYSRAEAFEIVKLASKQGADHSAFQGLVAACAQYAFVERGFRLGFAILKPKLVKVLNHFLHVPTHPLAHPVVEDRAAADYPRYFFESLPPRPVIFRREDCRGYLDRLLTELNGKAIVQCREFDPRQDYSQPEPSLTTA